MSAGDKRRMGPEPLSLPASSLKGFLLSSRSARTGLYLLAVSLQTDVVKK